MDFPEGAEHMAAWSRFIDRMLVTSLITSTPRSPISRSRPPVASFVRSRLAVAESRAPSE